MNLVFFKQDYPSPEKLPPYRALSDNEHTVPHDVVIIEDTTLGNVYDAFASNQTSKVPHGVSCKATIIGPGTDKRMANYYKEWSAGAMVLRFGQFEKESQVSALRHSYNASSTKIIAALRYFKDIPPPQKLIKLHPIASRALPLP